MRILLLGPGSDSFTASLDEAGIQYERNKLKPQPGVIINATGDVVQFVGQAIPWAAVATVLVAWLRGRSSRKIIVTTKDNKVVHTEGYSVEQFQQILEKSRELAVIDRNEPQITKHDP